MSYAPPLRPPPDLGSADPAAARRARAELARALEPPRAAVVLLAAAVPLFIALCVLAWRAWR